MSIFSQATDMAAQISLASLWHLSTQASHFLQLSVESIWRIHNETGTFDVIKLGCSVALNRHHCSQHLDPSTRGTSLLSSTALLLHRAPFSTTEKAMRMILRSWLSISWSSSASCSPHRMRGSEILELHRWLQSSFHTFMNHSKEVWKLGNELDHLGIVLVIWGSMVPIDYFGFLLLSEITVFLL